MTKILVTGGTGFIGSYLVNELAQIKKNQITVIDNNFRGKIENIIKKKNINFKKVDILNRPKIFDLLKKNKFDKIFHLAFINGTKNFYNIPQKVLEIGIVGTINLMDAVNKFGVKSFFYASTSEVYQDADHYPTKESVVCKVPDVTNPRYSYGSSKILGEVLTFHYLKNAKKKFVFRPHNVYGPKMGWDHVIPEVLKKIYKASNKLKKKKIFLTIQGSGKETRSFCYIEDAIKGILAIDKKGKDGQIYNIGAYNEVNVKQLVKKISKILDIKVSIKYGKLAKGSPVRRCPNIKKIKKLSYNPSFKLESGLNLTVNWYLKKLLDEKL